MSGPFRNGSSRGGRVETVDQLLDAVFHTPEAKEQLAKFKVFSHWKDIVGEGIAAHSSPYRVRGAQLLVEVTSTVWMNELHLRQQMILAKIEKMFPGSNIESIRFLLEKDVGRKKRERLIPKDKRRLDVELSEEEVQEIIDVIDEVEEDGLREAMWQLFYHNAQYNKGGSK